MPERRTGTSSDELGGSDPTDARATRAGASRPDEGGALDPSPPDDAEFRRVLGQFPTGVTIVTTVVDGRMHGTTVNAFASVSLRPPLVVVAAAADTRMLQNIRAACAFAVTILADTQHAAAEWFATPGHPSGEEAFADRSWRPAPHSGAPVLTGGVAWLDCALDALHTAGDHELCIGRVTHLGVLDDTREPLQWLRSDYR